MKKVLQVVRTLELDDKAVADHRCSVHVHLEIADLTETQLAAVVSWWVKCEPVFMDAMPMERKRNRYCQLIGMNNSYHHDGEYSDTEVIQRVGDVKYYSMNTNQYCRGGRKTIEFRIIEGAGCKDAYLVKQWIRLLIHFVETAAAIGRPLPYQVPRTDSEKFDLTPWTGLAWLDPDQVLTFLGFDAFPQAIPGHRPARNYTLSNGMKQTRNWFLARLMTYMSKHKPGGMRYQAYQRLADILQKERERGVDICPVKHMSPTEQREDELYGESQRI